MCPISVQFLEEGAFDSNLCEGPVPYVHGIYLNFLYESMKGSNIEVNVDALKSMCNNTDKRAFIWKTALWHIFES